MFLRRITATIRDVARGGQRLHLDARSMMSPDSRPFSMICRDRCGACCTAPSISSPIPGMPQGKPAGVPCVQLDADQRCGIFGHPERPAVCASLQPSAEMCGASREQAMHWLTWLEAATA